MVQGNPSDFEERLENAWGQLTLGDKVYLWIMAEALAIKNRASKLAARLVELVFVL